MIRKKEEIPLRKMTEPQGHEPLAQEKCDHWRKPECQGQGSTLASSLLTICVDPPFIGYVIPPGTFNSQPLAPKLFPRRLEEHVLVLALNFSDLKGP